MKQKICIVLAYSPTNLLSNQGILRLLLSLVKTEKFRNRIVIATACWSHRQLKEVLLEAKISLTDIEIILSSRVQPLTITLFSIIYKFYNRLKRKNINKKGRFQQALTKISSHLPKFAAKNFIFLIISTPISAIICTIKATILIYKQIKLVATKKLKLNNSGTQQVYPSEKKTKKDKILKKLKNVKNKLQITKSIKLHIKTIYNHIKTSEFEKLIKKINRRKNIDICYVPAAFLLDVHSIKKPVVLAVPDIVFLENPTLFIEETYENSYSHHTIKKNLASKASLLCYSDYVKTSHLIDPYKINKDKINVIKHGNTSLSQHLKNNPIEILQQFQKEKLNHDTYLSNYHLPSMKFLFYSSQVRPHKNILNLIKSYALLLRRRFINVKLILTGNLERNKELSDYVLKNRLQYDVISFYDIPDEVLAALNQCAICAVNPSLFEGGFPFTFSEAYSMGTPSVMSRIPVVLEEIEDKKLQELMLFDPYNIEDIADKIEWAIHNREELYQLQKPLYEKFMERSWEKVAGEYLNYFDETAAREKASHVH